MIHPCKIQAQLCIIFPVKIDMEITQQIELTNAMDDDNEQEIVMSKPCADVYA